MMCHDCQPLLLDHLYGLLDAAETAAVAAHLAGCPACSTARSNAARAQGLFAQAAKSEFPQVQFAAPVEEAAIPSTRTAARRSTRRNWLGWAVAASVLLLIPGTLVPLSKLTSRYNSAKREIEDAFVRLADARTAYERGKRDNAAQARLDAANEQHNRTIAEWLAAEKAEQARTVSVEVKKPIAAQPGAPNEFVIVVADPRETLRDRRVEAQFRDQSGAVLFSQNIDPKAKAGVRLPAEVWTRVKPQSDLYLSISAVNAAGERTEIQEPIRLFGPVYATMLATDKASYRPGDRLYFRSLTLDRITFRPPNREQKLQYVLRKQDGSGEPIAVLTGSTLLAKESGGAVETVTDQEGKPIRGVGCGAFVLPATLADGDYILTLSELAGPNGMPPAMSYPATRAVKVRSGAPERFAKKITFDKPSYTPGPGQSVTAFAELKLGDKPLAGAKVKAVVIADGKPNNFVVITPQIMERDGRKTPITGENGRVKIVFPILEPLARGDVKIVVAFALDNIEESLAERVPIAGKEIVVEFFPEGGKLIAGVPNRVYVRGTAAGGKPIDVRGTVADDREIVARVESPIDDHPGVNRGLGSFTFIPNAEAKYTLRLRNPSGLASDFPLPKAEADGVVLTALDTVTKPGQPIRLRVHSVGKDRNLVVGAYTRGQIADTQKIVVKAGKPEIVTLLATADSRGGVTRITVFEEPANKTADLIPVAERLVFRKPGAVLNLTASAGAAASFAPGSAIDLAIAATDEKGNAVPAILWAAAVNTAVAPGPKDRMLPTHFLLAGEVQSPDELEHADFLLTDHPKAAEVLDHVLATQGWRKFVEQARAPVEPGSAIARHLKATGQVLASSAVGKVAERFWPRFEESAKELERAKSERDAANRAVMIGYLQFEESRRDTARLADNVRTAAEPLDQLRDRLTLAIGVVAILTLMLGLLARARGASAAPYIVGTLVAAGLAVYLAMERPAAVPEEPAALPRPSTNGKTPVPKSVHLPPVPPDPIADENGEVPSVEPRAISMFGGPPFVLPPIPAPRAPKPTVSIPADLLPGSPKPLVREPVPAGVLSSFQQGDAAAREKAQLHGDDRAKALMQQIEAALGGNHQAESKTIRTAVPRTPPLVVREYAAPLPGSNDPTAYDADTVLWQPVIVLPSDGKTALRFHLGHAPGGYQVIVAGHTQDGRIGSVRTILPIAPAK